MKRIDINAIKGKLRPFAIIGRIFWLPYTITLFLTIAATILSAAAPLVFGKIIDAISSVQDGMSQETLFSQAIRLVIIYLLIQMVASGLKAWANYTAASQSEKISHYLRAKLAKTIFHEGSQHEPFFKNDRGKILSFFSRDIESLWDLFGFALTDLISSAIMILVLCLIVFSINPLLGVILITISIFFSLAFYRNGQKVRRYFADASPKFDRMIGFITSALAAYETVVSFRAQPWVNQSIGRESQDVTRLANKAHFRSTSFMFITSCINLFGLLIVWALCLPGLLGKNSAPIDITLGQFVAVLAYFAMVMGPLENISGSAKAISKGIVSMERLSLFVDHVVDRSSVPPLPIQNSLNSNAIATNSSALPLQVSGLVYNGCSESNQPIRILNGISFDIHPGEMIGLAGESGSGKSTLLRLLARLIEPSDGSIFYQGISIEKIEEDEFRQYITYISQASAIFPVDLRQNLVLKELALKEPMEGEDSALQSAIEMASVANFISRFDKYSDMEMAGLSGGEAQRVSLARAFFRGASVMLIDEPTSALDLTNSLKIAHSLQAAAHKGAVLVASHDEHILEKCTRVLVLNEGIIVASGTHSELQRESSLYQSIIFSTEV
ncbi:ABC transporter ATP-binding protein [Xenorhabdus anantnagensis]|uniref:ABC transporter ATP-binding protein n=1 Tax=Xenorhabdus anantnagensis TaxID=3025875 RepID=A0ABT5LRN4_9GAMM|nr:ABC transporter ATP-binding protein [Xenorhabdus anantnagensis]MDC9597092.1 ABC transporter ATP-binding protein [Xenorhabdus anantnagensis]